MKKPRIIGYYRYWVVLTYASIVSAIVGITMACQGQITAAIVCLMISGVCDMFDGTVARRADRNDTEKGYGIQIDALADVISFGAFPAVLGYNIYIDKNPYDNWGMVLTVSVMAMYVLCALIRLAYFNVTEEEMQEQDVKRTYYEGLPVTSAAMIVPVVYALVGADSPILPLVYDIMLFLIAICFVLKVKVPKLKLPIIIGMAIGCLVVVAAALIIRGVLG